MVPRLQDRVDAGMPRCQDACVIGLDTGRLELEHHALGMELDDFAGHRRSGAYTRDSGERFCDLTDDAVRVGGETEMDFEGSKTPRV